MPKVTHRASSACLTRLAAVRKATEGLQHQNTQLQHLVKAQTQELDSQRTELAATATNKRALEDKLAKYQQLPYSTDPPTVHCSHTARPRAHPLLVRQKRAAIEGELHRETRHNLEAAQREITSSVS